MRHTRGPTLLLLLLLAVLAWPRTAAAQDAAVESWNRGLQLFNRGSYAEAMKAFARGYQLSRKAGFLFNMAECARLMNDRARARQLYVRYLTEHPQGKLRAEALRRCEELGLGPCPALGREDLPGESPPPPPPPALQPTPQPAPYLPARQEAPPPPGKPFYKRWPLWVGVGAVVIAGTVTAAVLASRSHDRAVPEGNYVVDFGR